MDKHLHRFILMQFFFISILHQFWLRLQGGINAKSAKKMQTEANSFRLSGAPRGLTACRWRGLVKISPATKMQHSEANVVPMCEMIWLGHRLMFHYATTAESDWDATSRCLLVEQPACATGRNKIETAKYTKKCKNATFYK